MWGVVSALWLIFPCSIVTKFAYSGHNLVEQNLKNSKLIANDTHCVRITFSRTVSKYRKIHILEIALTQLLLLMHTNWKIKGAQKKQLIIKFVFNRNFNRANAKISRGLKTENWIAEDNVHGSVVCFFMAFCLYF